MGGRVFHELRLSKPAPEEGTGKILPDPVSISLLRVSSFVAHLRNDNRNQNAKLNSDYKLVNESLVHHERERERE